MELVEVDRAKENRIPFTGTINCPCNVKCTKRYVQPARVQSFAPQKVYNPPAEPLENNTTYVLSFLNNEDARHCRSQPIRPRPAIDRSTGKFCDETTTRLSYKPVWGATRTKSILPRHRSMVGTGRMENVTTIRHDYVAKSVDRPELIVPCANIRLSKGNLEDKTTAKLSYGHPGPMQPITNFKPVRAYCPPSVPILDCTTQKLSYQPFVVPDREDLPWMRKPRYRPPVNRMCGKTTYGESFLKNEEPRMERPIVPPRADLFPCGEQFQDKTIYKESYLECKPDRVRPFLPSNSISTPGGKISMDTTTKLSYQSIRGERRAPILPPASRMTSNGPMESETTTRREFVAKLGPRPDMIVPANNLKTPDAPIEDGTTTRLSYMKPEQEERAQSFKPVAQYCRSAAKIEADTVSKLSYQPWAVPEREEITWRPRNVYERPKDPMVADTIYQMSFPAPGHYEECPPSDCDCPANTEGVL